MNEYLDLFYSVSVNRGDHFDVDSYTNSYRKRSEWCRKFSWAIPTDAALQRIADLGPIVEIGAGTGYWTYLLREMGVDVKAYDVNPPGEPNCQNGWHPNAAQWTPVIKGGPERAYWHEDRALFLCWPPYNTPMAFDALKVYRGNTMIYVGEGGHGCTGDKAFHDLMESEWNVEWFDLPQWDGIHDGMHVCTRRLTDSKHSEILSSC